MVNRKTTDLDGVKIMARTLLYTDINKTAYSPMIVQHPFTNTGFTMVMRNGEPKCVDITADSQALNEWRKMVCEQIDSAKSAFEIYMMTNNGAIIENEAAVVKYVYNKIIDYTKNPPADMVEGKIAIAKENGEEITYEEAAKLVTTSEIEYRIWDEIRANPDFVEAIIAYNKRAGHNSNPTTIVGMLRSAMGCTSEPIVSAEEFSQAHKAQSERVAVYCRFKTAKDAYSPVVLYARESNHEGADESLERQKEKLKDFCAEKGYDIADEVAIIGSREESLPALKKAIEFAQATPSRTILMASSNRVVGTASEMESIAELVNKSGVIIHTMDGSYEYADQYHTTPEAIMASTLAGFDADIDEDDPDEDEGMGGMSL